MSQDAFERAVEFAPEEQRRLLEKMMELGLVLAFAWHDDSGRWAIEYTSAGREFLRLVKAMAAPEPPRRLARLLALEALGEQAVFPGGFSQE